MKLFNNLKDNWKKNLDFEFSKPYITSLNEFILSEYESNVIYPDFNNIFKCFNITDFYKVKIVILGQDPYPSGHADGLAFSVLTNMSLTSSLNNIYREIHNDLGIKNTGKSLEKWADQGVLLMNSILTVQKNKPMSHKDFGWEFFTDSVISILSKANRKIIFILWGQISIKKVKLINVEKNIVLTSSHPSSNSADKGFFYSRPFSRSNMFLKMMKKTPIDWYV
jgi:uracil-DNA glycosylase